MNAMTTTEEKQTMWRRNRVRLLGFLVSWVLYGVAIFVVANLPTREGVMLGFLILNAMQMFLTLIAVFKK